MKFRTYTVDAVASQERQGVYDQSEWGAARLRHDFRDLVTTPTQETYLKLMADPAQQPRTQAGEELARRFGLEKYKRIGDLGGCAYPQSFGIHRLHPHIEFMLSDYDRGSNAIMRKIPGFFATRILDINLKSDAFDDFATCDALVMWAVDYALEDDELVRLFRWAAVNRIDFFLCSQSMGDFWLGVRRFAGHLHRKLTGRPDRAHGWMRTYGHMRKLLAQAGARIERTERIAGYDVWLLRAQAG